MNSGDFEGNCKSYCVSCYHIFCVFIFFTVLVVSAVPGMTASQVLDREGDGSRENHSAEDAEDQKESSHHSGDRLMLANHVAAM